MRSPLWGAIALTLTVALNCGAQEQPATQPEAQPSGGAEPAEPGPAESPQPESPEEKSPEASSPQAESSPTAAAELVAERGTDVASEPPEPAAAVQMKEEPPVYVRPQAGVPGGRRSGGVRSAASCEGLALELLAPEAYEGWTLSEQPSLFWYLSAIPAPDCAGEGFRFTLASANAADPLVEVALDTPGRPGVHRIRLSDYDVSLEPGTPYTWSVSLARSGASPFAQADLRYVPPADDTARKLADAGPATAAHARAEAGYWYDALEAVAEQIDAHPGDVRLARWWSSLLAAESLDMGGALPQ